MNADMLNALSERIIGCAFTVANGLGSGFLERVYENALAHELRKAGLTVAQQQGVSVTYERSSSANMPPTCWWGRPSS
jgi:GxxExxY protein